MITLFLLLDLAGCCLLYLSHRHQGWLAQPLPAAPARAGGVLALLLSLCCALAVFSVITALFAWLAAAMLAISLLPFFSLMIKRSKREHQA